MPELQYREPYRAKCESVTLERKISDFVPDIIVSVRGKICLAYGVNVNLGNGWRKLTLPYDVIEKYIEYLIYIGFLEKSDYRAGIVTRTHSLIPPNETEAKLPENAIKRSL